MEVLSPFISSGSPEIIIINALITLGYVRGIAGSESCGHSQGISKLKMHVPFVQTLWIDKAKWIVERIRVLIKTLWVT